MAHFPGGSFWGYRAWLPLGGVGIRLRLPWWVVASLDRVPTDLQVFTGNAPDAYAGITAFRNQSLLVLIIVWDNAAHVRFSPDGAAVTGEEEVDPDNPEKGKVYKLMSARGFEIRNHTAGDIARYLVAAFF